MIARLHLCRSDYQWFLDNSRRRYRFHFDDPPPDGTEQEFLRLRIVFRDGRASKTVQFVCSEFEDSDAYAEDLLVEDLRNTAGKPRGRVR